MKKNSIAICIATGSSLTLEDVEFCQGKGKIYAVKEAITYAPFADVLYAADTDWWDDRSRWEWFQGEKWTVSHEAKRKFPEFNHIDYKVHSIWSDDKSYLATGGNSGFQAINLADLNDHDYILLLGYDYGYTGDKHFWERHIKRESRYSNYQDWLKRLEKAAPLIKAKVINCSRQTAIECFERDTIQNALRRISG